MTAHQTICATLDQAVSKGIAPGMAIAFGRSDQSWLHYSAGAAMLEPHQIPLQNGAYFDLASLTKVLATTLIIMRFYERGILDIDAPLAQLQPTATLGPLRGPASNRTALSRPASPQPRPRNATPRNAVPRPQHPFGLYAQ
jgi:CubicO group peptidase (beta-lactamase class C family)